MKISEKLLYRFVERLPWWTRRPFIPRPFVRSTYNADGFATTHSAAFFDDANFMAAYEAGMSTPHGFSRHTRMEWRVFVSCWAANQGLHRDGAFVECGVNTGITALAVAKFLGLDRNPIKPYYLLDTYRGIPEDQFIDEERSHGELLNTIYYDCYDQVVTMFAGFPSVRIIRGEIPGTLAQIDAEQISYLSIDLNVAYAEKCVLETLWDRVIPGGLIVLDDYGYADHQAQRKVHDAFAASKGLFVLALPTGQGIIQKP